MIAFVNGVVRIIRSDRVVLDVHGVGYEVYLANALSQKMGDELFLYTYQHVREDAILLFGFLKEEDYEELMREKVFIRDGKSVDSAGVINTTNTFVEED